MNSPKLPNEAACSARAPRSPRTAAGAGGSGGDVDRVEPLLDPLGEAADERLAALDLELALAEVDPDPRALIQEPLPAVRRAT